MKIFLLPLLLCSLGQGAIVHFAQLDTNVYSGSKPTSDADFQFLQSKHIKYILNAKFLPLLSASERKKAKRYGIGFLSVEMNASPIPPSEKHVDRILCLLRDKELQPIYVHCVLGRDRTSLIAGLYKIYFLGMAPEDAWREMKQSGFKSWWLLRGLKTYFEKHSIKRQSAVCGELPHGAATFQLE